MDLITEFIIEVLFRGMVVQIFGLYPRYYFFKFFGKEKDIKYLSGEKHLNDSTDIIQQHVFNVVIGLSLFTTLSFLIAYIAFS